MSITLLLFLFRSDFNISSLNIRGGRDAKKHAELCELIKIKRIDVTHSNRESEYKWMTEWEGQVVLSWGSSVNAGVDILFSKYFYLDP